ncbi:orcokinin precursor [Danaus plexippus plexippus]|uniref:Orcokinin n=1 Tax=Danaus plexippus plexippus TaxID=278856 RepID=A0A212FJB5_DANPL|nr:orcokinin precursor [Danaus plexippus plexippus]
MMAFRGPLALAVATLLVLCNADPRQEQDVRVGEQSGDRYGLNDIRQKEQIENFMRFLMQYENLDDNNNARIGIGGSSMLGKSVDYPNDSRLGIGGSSMLGRDLRYGYNGMSRIGGSSMLGRSLVAKRFLDPLGGGNFVRNLDSIGGGNFVRNLDSIGGNNFVKKNLDQIGGPNLVKRNLDSLGGGNLVRNLDSIGGGNFVRHVDPLGGHKIRNLDPLGGGHLVRELRESHRFPYYLARKYEYGRSIGGKRDPWLFTSPMEYGYYGDVPKRNFDEIDRSNLDSFVKKRNFDEIDQTSMPFPFKRFYHVYGSNYLDTALSNFDKKRYRPDYPMDEIDLSQFPIGSKRSEISAIHPMR